MKNLVKFREAKGLSQMDLARLTGIPQTTLSSYEKNVREPKVKIAKQIAKVFGCKWYELYE